MEVQEQLVDVQLIYSTKIGEISKVQERLVEADVRCSEVHDEHAKDVQPIYSTNPGGQAQLEVPG